MSNWKERLQEEKNELALRLMKLDEFMWSERFEELSQDEKDILVKQENAMTEYLAILEARLEKAVEKEDERMKVIVRNGNDGAHYWYDDTERSSRILAEGRKYMEEITLGIRPKDETEYLTSSKANREHLEQAMKEFDKACDEHLDRVAETEITPRALIELGFKEEYQPSIDGEAGYLYYEYNLHGVELLSTTLEDEVFFVFTQDDYEIHQPKFIYCR